MVRVVVDGKTIGQNNVFGSYDPNKEGTLTFWLPEHEKVSLDCSEEFIYIMNCPCLSREFEKYDFSILEDIDCKIFINDAFEGSSWLPQEVNNFTLYLKMCGIDPKRVTVITQNYNYEDANFPFKIVIWNLMESFARVRAKEWIDYNDDAKKFLCLNRTVPDEYNHKGEFMRKMEESNILDQFNYSLPNKPYDNVVWPTNIVQSYGQPYPGPGGLFWDFPEHKKESLLYIVTETFFDIDHLRDVSEKTWRPIALQMPFILVHQPFALRRLRDLGYRTFSNLPNNRGWDESYDEIEDPTKRMSAIVDLVLELNSRTNFRVVIDSCREIVEHNFNTLKKRRPEREMLKAMNFD